MYSLKISSFLIQTVLPIPGFCHHGGCECSFLPHPVPCQSLLTGRRKTRILPFPAPFTQAVCPARCHRFLRWLWLGAVWSWQPEPCQPSRAQGTIWLIPSVSQQGPSASPCPGTLVTQLLALLTERGCLICGLHSSDSRELSVLMLPSLSFSPR